MCMNRLELALKIQLYQSSLFKPLLRQHNHLQLCRLQDTSHWIQLAVSGMDLSVQQITPPPIFLEDEYEVWRVLMVVAGLDV